MSHCMVYLRVAFIAVQRKQCRKLFNHTRRIYNIEIISAGPAIIICYFYYYYFCFFFQLDIVYTLRWMGGLVQNISSVYDYTVFKQLLLSINKNKNIEHKT
jgi:hypothetical protein